MKVSWVYHQLLPVPRDGNYDSTSLSSVVFLFVLNLLKIQDTLRLAFFMSDRDRKNFLAIPRKYIKGENNVRVLTYMQVNYQTFDPMTSTFSRVPHLYYHTFYYLIWNRPKFGFHVWHHVCLLDKSQNSDSAFSFNISPWVIVSWHLAFCECRRFRGFGGLCHRVFAPRLAA